MFCNKNKSSLYELIYGCFWFVVICVVVVYMGILNIEFWLDLVNYKINNNCEDKIFFLL